jgi:hypothetical protein
MCGKGSWMTQKNFVRIVKKFSKFIQTTWFSNLRPIKILYQAKILGPKIFFSVDGKPK